MIVLGDGEISNIKEPLENLFASNSEFSKFVFEVANNATASKTSQLHAWQPSLYLESEGRATCEMLVQSTNPQVNGLNLNCLLKRQEYVRLQS